VGYTVASVEPLNDDESRNILQQYEASSLHNVINIRENEDIYRALARQSLEYMVNTGKKLPSNTDVSEELSNKRAGVFVSLHKNGRLRGCVGTISPTTKCIADEIIQNAVSAGLYDNRFEPVTKSELPFLVYKVDVLAAPESISGPEKLDVKRYGVIVTSGGKRGLLLPNLDGIDTVEEQIQIAKQKAGISDNMPVKLERFEVVRHE
jgi:AmmeMemoRadiSam system protein A